MNPTNYYTHEELICTGNGYKPSNLHKWGPGVRDIHALHYVIKGKGYFETNNTKYALKAGESFIIFPYTEAYYYPDPKNPWEYIWIDFKGDEALRLLSMTNFSNNNPIAPAFPWDLEPLFHIIENDNVKIFERERSNAKLRLLLSYYIEYYPKANVISQTNYVLTAKEYIENNYWKTTLTVANIVDFVKIERTYLFRLFKEATGMSISNYLASYRIKCACDLLKTSKLSIKSVACSVGYQDQLYFSKVFKKATLCSPSEYKKIYSNVIDG
ncbi:AraC family transcriptional regulator [Clostridium oryzae]|uniref:Arabinose operon regulatory protein n=1 Tax=Clostridium oryzae TaxID=1450648 RepID=A0A1V4IHN1_9CLOT|nr:AraC family transcriptional regulator [Clostridium oryzae]OPJ59511.1 arabinose operon regulatory protein [Clostridium oryzae]